MFFFERQVNLLLIT